MPRGGRCSRLYRPPPPLPSLTRTVPHTVVGGWGGRGDQGNMLKAIMRYWQLAHALMHGGIQNQNPRPAHALMHGLIGRLDRNFCLKASLRLWASSVEMLRTEGRAVASCTARDELQVVLPTPPLPPTKIHLSFCCSTKLFRFVSVLAIKKIRYGEQICESRERARPPLVSERQRFALPLTAVPQIPPSQPSPFGFTSLCRRFGGTRWGFPARMLHTVSCFAEEMRSTAAQRPHAALHHQVQQL